MLGNSYPSEKVIIPSNRPSICSLESELVTPVEDWQLRGSLVQWFRSQESLLSDPSSVIYCVTLGRLHDLSEFNVCMCKEDKYLPQREAVKIK